MRIILFSVVFIYFVGKSFPAASLLQSKKAYNLISCFYFHGTRVRSIEFTVNNVKRNRFFVVIQTIEIKEFEFDLTLDARLKL